MTRNQAVLKIDVDRPEHPDLDTMHKLLQRAGYRAVDTMVRQSPSGNGWHVVIQVQPRPKCPFEVVALQAILGGDVWREARQMERARAFQSAPKWMRNHWNVLYLSHPQRTRHLSLESVT